MSQENVHNKWLYEMCGRNKFDLQQSLKDLFYSTCLSPSHHTTDRTHKFECFNANTCAGYFTCTSWRIFYHLGFAVITVVSRTITAFCDLTPCNLINGDRRFGG